MAIERIAPVIPVDDLPAAVVAWTAVLGTEPTFVDGDRWAQFDVGPTRISLAGADRTSDDTGLMIKVDDLGAAAANARADGLEVGEIEEGPHELRVVVNTPGAPTTLYAAKPA